MAISIILLVLLSFILVYLSSLNKPDWSFEWTGIRQEVRDTVKVIAKQRMVGFGFCGINAKPHDRTTEKWLIKNATLEEMKKLVDYPSGSIKALAYSHILFKSDSIEQKEHYMFLMLNDTNYFLSVPQNGCVLGTFLPYQYFFHYYLMADFDDERYLDDRMAKFGFHDTVRPVIINLYHLRMSENERMINRIYNEK